MIARLRHDDDIRCYYGCQLFFLEITLCMLVGKSSASIFIVAMEVPVNLTAKYWLSYAVPISFCYLIPILFTQENKTNNLNGDMPRAGFEPTVLLFENRPVPYTLYKLGRYGTQLLYL